MILKTKNTAVTLKSSVERPSNRSPNHPMTVVAHYYLHCQQRTGFGGNGRTRRQSVGEAGCRANIHGARIDE